MNLSEYNQTLKDDIGPSQSKFGPKPVSFFFDLIIFFRIRSNRVRIWAKSHKKLVRQVSQCLALINYHKNRKKYLTFLNFKILNFKINFEIRRISSDCWLIYLFYNKLLLIWLKWYFYFCGERQSFRLWPFDLPKKNRSFQ